jgi:4a-hydroxytetrahydrobiopterin dehydratase
MSRLSKEQIVFNLSKIPGWKLQMDQIERQLLFSGFREAISFVNQVADYAEEMNHHPVIIVSSNQVTIKLTTKESGGLTGKDFALAQRINKLLLPRIQVG